jgi:putative sterol carrier protein
MTGKVKVKGDLLLAQRLEEAVEKMGAREVSRNGTRSYV